MMQFFPLLVKAAEWDTSMSPVTIYRLAFAVCTSGVGSYGRARDMIAVSVRYVQVR